MLTVFTRGALTRIPICSTLSPVRPMNYAKKDIFSAYYMDGSGFGNKDFTKNSIKYLAQNGGVISIGPKDLSPTYLDIPASQVRIVIALTVVVLPLIILAAGFFVWRKRRSL